MDAYAVRLSALLLPSSAMLCPMLIARSRDSGVNAIESLMERQGAFDYILLETTGLADPGNIAPLFWVDDGLGSTIYLDGIITLVDAKNILLSLNEKPIEAQSEDDTEGPLMTTAHLQISHADVVIINKADMVAAEQLQVVKERVQAINGLAKIHIAEFGKVPQLDGVLLGIQAYDGVGTLDVTQKGHGHLDPVRQHSIYCHLFYGTSLTLEARLSPQ